VSILVPNSEKPKDDGNFAHAVTDSRQTLRAYLSRHMKCLVEQMDVMKENHHGDAQERRWLAFAG
jgi:hypothetical protein